MIKKQGRLKNQKCILTPKKTLDEGASVFGKTMKRTKHSAVSLMTVFTLSDEISLKNCQRRLLTQSNPIQFFQQDTGPNPIQSNPTQSMDESNPCPTLDIACSTNDREVGIRVPLATGSRVATVGQLLFAPWAWVYSTSILSGSVNRVPACVAGVNAGCVRLCRVAGNTA